MNKFLWPLIGFLVLVVLLAIGLNLNPREVPSPLVGKPAPAFALPRLDNPAKTFSPEEMKGQVWLLNVWASWCAPCRAEAPILQSLWEEYGDDGVSFIGLNTRDSPATANSFEKAYGITYPSVVDSDGRLQLRFSGIAPPQAIPTTLVIDRDGKVAGRILGRASESTLRSLIEPLLASASDPSPSTATPTATDD